MTDQDRLELISAAIDGEIDDDEKVVLNDLLESSGEARKLQANLEQLDSLLKAVPDLEPSQSLHARIVAEAGSLLQPATRSRPVTDWLRQWMSGAGLGYALAASAGALLAAVFISSQSGLPGTADISEIVGTMAPRTTASNEDVIDSYALQQVGLESLVQLERRDDALLLTIKVNSVTPLDIAVDMTNAGVRPDALAQFESGFESIAIMHRTIQLRAQGQQRLSVLLRRDNGGSYADSASMTVIFSSDSGLRQQSVLKAAW